jgi:hypothetical protein
MTNDINCCTGCGKPEPFASGQHKGDKFTCAVCMGWWSP